MRNGQKRMRGRSNNNHRKSQNPLTRVYELNGPDVKIRGTASHIAEKYIQLARDSQSSGDPVAAENYYQHAEHYFRLIAAAQEQFRQQNPYYNQQGQQGAPGADDGDDYGDDDNQPFLGQNEPSYAPREAQPPQQPQPYLPRDAQPFPAARAAGGTGRPAPISRRSRRRPSTARRTWARLPAFITGGQPQQQPAPAQNGHDQQERYGTHRRRRRHRGPGFRARAQRVCGERRPRRRPQGEGGDEAARSRSKRVTLPVTAPAPARAPAPGGA